MLLTYRSPKGHVLPYFLTLSSSYHHDPTVRRIGISWTPQDRALKISGNELLPKQPQSWLTLHTSTWRKLSLYTLALSKLTYPFQQSKLTFYVFPMTPPLSTVCIVNLSSMSRHTIAINAIKIYNYFCYYIMFQIKVFQMYIFYIFNCWSSRLCHIINLTIHLDGPTVLCHIF